MPFVILALLLGSLPAPLVSQARGSAPAAPRPASPVREPAQQGPAVPTAVNIAAGKVDTLAVDVNGNTRANPGDTLGYTIAITDTGTTSATGVLFNDTLDPHTTLVAGSVDVSPLAFDDSYTTVGNTLLAVGVTPPANTPAVQVAGNVFSNDTEFLGDTFSLSTFQATSANGGTVSMNTNGTFTYLPAVGFIGADTFTYTIIDSAGLTDTATVTITVANKVWYVNNALGSNGDGRSSSPFNTLSSVNGAGGAGDADGPNDYIYLFTGSGNYAGGLPLEAGQTLIGQGVALVVGSFTLNPAGSRPTLTNAGGDALALSTNNTVSGLNILTGGAALSGVAGTGVGTLTINNASISGAGQAVDITTGALAVTFDSISTTSSDNQGVNLDSVTGSFAGNGGSLAGVSGTDFRVNGGTATVTYGGAIINTAGNSVEVTNRTGGSASFSGAISDTGSGVSLTSNTGSTITFSGGLSASTGANVAFNATGGGTVNVTGSSNVLTTTTASALNVANTTIGAGGLTFRSIAANGAASGIVLNTTGSSGGLTVSGSGTAGSGGTIQNSTGDGVSLQSTSNVSLTRMNITNNNGNGLYGNNLTNFTLASSSVTNNDADNVGTD